MTLAPTLTSATLVPNTRPEALSRNMAYGVRQGRSGRVASSTPMPGTMTRSWRRTQAAVRTASATIPAAVPSARRGRDSRALSGVYQCNWAAGRLYRAVTSSGRVHRMSGTTPGCSAPR